MQSGPLAGTLFGLVLVACGHTNLTGSPRSMNDGGATQDATTTRTMPDVSDASLPDVSVPSAVEDWDACAIADAGAMAPDGAYGSPGWTCTIPAQAHSIPSCQVVPNEGPGSPSCAPTEYGLFCSEEPDASSLGCNLRFIEQAPTHAWAYCCACEGTDAGTGCVNVDLSTYDRSCNKDSDCVEITSGRMCPGGCSCGGTAINADGLCRYHQTVAPLASSGVVCNCPADFGACCRAGRCVDDFCCLNPCSDAGTGD